VGTYPVTCDLGLKLGFMYEYRIFSFLHHGFETIEILSKAVT
jgi:hypothetical protein